MAETDAGLVVRVRRGDRSAASELAERYLRRCRAVALSILQEVPDAEDGAQDAFVYAMERIEDCRKPDRFGAWLFTIVRNRARNRIRDGKRNVALHETLPAGTSPAADAERALLRDRLMHALGQLTQVRREIVLLHDLEGWTHAEIADRLELPHGTVRSHLHHARRTLREILHADEGGLE